MNGPDHYREGERYAEIAGRHLTEHPGDMRIAEVAAWTAHAHATLALAAATVQASADVSQLTVEHEAAWREAGVL